jgi:hypothetical protein
MAHVTSSVVEATSLQTVNELAANPPNSPSPPRSGLQPLTLYIARVPGSRDVFLTPIKPREKVVSAEDVVSSLYYVHVSCDDDYEALRKPLSRPSSVNTNAGNLPTLTEETTRKVPPPLPKRRPTGPPTPPLPPYPTDDLPSLPRKAVPPGLPPRPQQIMRKPVITEDTNSSWHSAPAVRDHPLPTPPDEPPYNAQSLHAENLWLLRASSHLSEHDNPYSRNYDSHPETLKQAKADEQQLEADMRPESGTLTVIRRDPGTTQQWNVASVFDPPVHEVTSSTLLVPTAKRRTKKGGTPLYIEITNPGYAHFNADNPASKSQTSLSSLETGSTVQFSNDTFHRRLYLPGSVHSMHSYTSQPSFHRKSSSLSAASGEISIRQTMREERHSVDLGTAALADQRSKGYTFLSPWNGTCEFKTGSTGRTLKCKHRLGGRQDDVSELRFNLPSGAGPKKKAALGGRGERTSYISRHRHLFSRGEDDDEEDDDANSFAPSIVVTDDGRIDLELGRERAGGGFGGKQAKLGKLIIEPQGLAMLDLLVAANVGLWWRAWERV